MAIATKEVNCPSESSDATYKVTQYDDGSFSCTCPHFTFRHPSEGCKHIKRVRDGCTPFSKHKLRALTQQELNERGIVVHMFDNYYICTICSKVANFDSSG
jgi:hypothetical protein